MGGENATDGDWLGVVALLDAARVDEVESGALAATTVPYERIQPDEANQAALFCGGVLLAPRWVVTTASCLQRREPAGVLVLTNTSDLQQGGKRLAASNFYIHPDFNPQTGDADIALVELAHAVQGVVTGIGPVAAGASGTVLGWDGLHGRYQAFSAYRHLRQIGYTVVESARCIAERLAVPATAFCAVANNYPQMLLQGRICPADRGGPIFSGQGSSARLLGIVASHHDCGIGADRSHARFTRIDDFRDWIRGYTGNLPGDNQPPTVSLQRLVCNLGSHSPPVSPDDCLLVGGSPTPFLLKGRDPDGSLVSFKVDFGDGKVKLGDKEDAHVLESGRGPAFGNFGAWGLLHRYEKPGNYTVTASVTDDRGATATEQIAVRVEAFKPLKFEKPQITLNALDDGRVEILVRIDGTTGNSTFCERYPAGCLAGISVDYGDASSDANKTSHDINGPQSFPIMERFVHRYEAPGSYTLKVSTKVTQDYFESRGYTPTAESMTTLIIRDSSNADDQSSDAGQSTAVAGDTGNNGSDGEAQKITIDVNLNTKGVTGAGGSGVLLLIALSSLGVSRRMLRRRNGM